MNKILLSAAFSLLVFGTAYSQKKESVKAKAEKIDQDSLAQVEEKKKAAAEEKARLPKPYHPEDNAEEKINELVNIAKEQKKNIILQAGGNWCIWCLRFNDFIQNNEEIRNVVNNNYLYYHLNWSPENKNEKIFASYGDPGKVYGYPVLLVLNSEGKLIHTQETGVLEDGKGYSSDKVLQFFEKWMYTE